MTCKPADHLCAHRNAPTLAVPSRRAVLGGGAAALALAGLGSALAAPRQSGLIDVHHHIVPPRNGMPAAQVAYLNWSPEGALAQMDSAGVATAIAYPGPVLFGEAREKQELARVWNEFGAGLGEKHRNRFGLFATLPIPDPDACAAEIDYALDILKADGFGISTNYGDAWLGDEIFEPIFAKMNARGAVVFVHPFNCAVCGPANFSYQRKLATPGVEQGWLEWPMSTARTIMNLLVSGTVRRYPRIRFIFAHGGGVMPMLVERIAGLAHSRSIGEAKLRALFPDGVNAAFAKLFFEGAQALSAPNLSALRALVPDSQILFGSDYPYFSLDYAADRLAGLKLRRSLREAISHDNARRLLTRWA